MTKFYLLILCLLFLDVRLLATEVVLIELDKKTENALGFYPWEQERQLKLVEIMQKRAPQVLLSLLPKLKIDETAEELLKKNPNLFLRGQTSKSDLQKQVGEFRHQAEEVLLYDTSKNFQNILYSVLEFLKLSKSEKNVSWTYKGNLTLSSYKKISALDFFTLEELPDIKDKIVILAYHGRNQVKEKGTNNIYTHPGNVAAAILVEMLNKKP